MPDEDIDRLIERVIGAARIPRRAARADLRRELRAHFEDAGASADAIRRFGGEREIVAAFRRVYAVEYALLYALKLCASIAASILAALAIELATTIRVEPRPVLFAMAVVVTVVAAWEMARPPAAVVRTALARGRVFVMFTLFAGIEFSVHLAIGVPFGARRAALAGLVLTMVAAATLAILARVDRAFAAFFESV